MRKKGEGEDRMKKNLQRKEYYKKFLQILHTNLCKHYQYSSMNIDFVIYQ